MVCEVKGIIDFRMCGQVALSRSHMLVPTSSSRLAAYEGSET